MIVFRWDLAGMLPPDSWYYKLLFDIWFLCIFFLPVFFGSYNSPSTLYCNDSLLCLYVKWAHYIDHPILKCDGMSSHMLRFIDVCVVLLWGSLFFSLTVQISRYNYIWYTLNVFSVLCSVGSPTLWASSSELFELSLLQFGSNIQLSFQTSISWLEFGRGSCYEGA